MKYQLTIQISANSTNDFDEMIEFEDELIEILKDIAIIDGHDFGSGEANIFVLTNDQYETYNVIKEKYLNATVKNKYKISCREIKNDNLVILFPDSLTDFHIK